jgi:hypothetical protein
MEIHHRGILLRTNVSDVGEAVFADHSERTARLELDVAGRVELGPVGKSEQHAAARIATLVNAFIGDDPGARASFGHEQGGVGIAANLKARMLVFDHRELPVFGDGFESGDTSVWSATVP